MARVFFASWLVGMCAVCFAGATTWAPTVLVAQVPGEMLAWIKELPDAESERGGLAAADLTDGSAVQRVSDSLQAKSP